MENLCGLNKNLNSQYQIFKLLLLNSKSSEERKTTAQTPQKPKNPKKIKTQKHHYPVSQKGVRERLTPEFTISRAYDMKALDLDHDQIPATEHTRPAPADKPNTQ